MDHIFRHGYQSFTCVGSHVDDELSGLDECFATVVALMRPFTRVDPHVPVQLAAVLETATAMRTAVRLLLGVNAPMDAQILFD